MLTSIVLRHILFIDFSLIQQMNSYSCYCYGELLLLAFKVQSHNFFNLRLIVNIFPLYSSRIFKTILRFFYFFYQTVRLLQ
jgi:hypothetical protein